MSWHNDVGIHAQEFIADAEVQAFGDYFTGSFIDKYRQPFNDRKGYKIGAYSFDDAIFFYELKPSVSLM